MTTLARNYASQVSCLAKNLATSGRLTGIAKSVVDTMARLMPTAQHFSMPDGGKIFNDELKGLVGEDIKLPFPCITVETFCDGFRYCITAAQGEEGILILSAGSDGDWKILPFMAFVYGVDKEGISAKLIGDEGEENVFEVMNFCS